MFKVSINNYQVSLMISLYQIMSYIIIILDTLLTFIIFLSYYQ